MPPLESPPEVGPDTDRTPRPALGASSVGERRVRGPQRAHPEHPHRERSARRAVVRPVGPHRGRQGVVVGRQPTQRRVAGPGPTRAAETAARRRRDQHDHRTVRKPTDGCSAIPAMIRTRRARPRRRSSRPPRIRVASLRGEQQTGVDQPGSMRCRAEATAPAWASCRRGTGTAAAWCTARSSSSARGSGRCAATTTPRPAAAIVPPRRMALNAAHERELRAAVQVRHVVGALGQPVDGPRGGHVGERASCPPDEHGDHDREQDVDQQEHGAADSPGVS